MAKTALCIASYADALSKTDSLTWNFVDLLMELRDDGGSDFLESAAPQAGIRRAGGVAFNDLRSDGGGNGVRSR